MRYVCLVCCFLIVWCRWVGSVFYVRCMFVNNVLLFLVGSFCVCNSELRFGFFLYDRLEC